MKLTRQESILKLFHDGQAIPAIPLCLDEDRQFNPDEQRSLIRYYLEAGVGGIAIAVHTTQFAIRDSEINLFETVLKLAVDEINAYELEHNIEIIKVSGVCGDDEQAVAETLIARDLGFDLVLLSTGGRQDDSEAELIVRTKIVSEILPTIGFSMQTAVGGRLFSPKYWEDLCEISGVVGIKVAPFNRYETIAIARSVAMSSRTSKLTLYTGNDDNIVLDLLTPFKFVDDEGMWHEIRIKGGLLGHWSVWTKAAVELFNELKRYRIEHLDQIPLDLLTRAAWVTEANGAVFDYRNNFAGCIPGVHQGLVDDGHMSGVWTLDEEEGLSPGQLEEIRRMHQYPGVTDK